MKPLLSISSPVTTPSLSTVIPTSANLARMTSSTAGVLACGLAKTNAVFFLAVLVAALSAAMEAEMDLASSEAVSSSSMSEMDCA